MLDQARQSLAQLPAQRRALLGAVVVGVVVALLAVARWASQPDYALLFGNLPAQDAGRIVEQLEAAGTRYDLRDGGASVYVPRDEVYGLRLQMATEGVVTDGPAGYELFDAGTLGMTDFMQKLNVKRALEGELSRTIGSIRQVERARVHLVLPERSPFRDQQASPTASVVLAVRGQLAPDQVAGVTALVAGAVEGLEPTDVTVLDEAGRMLASPQMNGAEAGLSTAQVRMRQEIETHLAGAAQTMLDRVFGPGRAAVRVAADLDLSRVSTETRSVDPDAQALLSEETQEERDEGGAATSVVRNYEVTRQTTRTEREAGDLRSLTVSVLLDEAAPPVDLERPREPGAPTPFSDEQLRQVESLVKNAVGFNEERGDRFAVQQIRFSAPPEEAGVFAGTSGAEWAGLGLRYGVVLLVLVLAYRLLKSLSTSLTAAASAPPPAVESGAVSVDADGLLVGLPAAGPPRATIEAADDPYAAKLTPEARESLDESDRLDEVRARIAEDPQAAAAVVRRWLREDAAS